MYTYFMQWLGYNLVYYHRGDYGDDGLNDDGGFYVEIYGPSGLLYGWRYDDGDDGDDGHRAS